MLTAIGTEPRLRIMRWPLAARPEGLVVGDIAAEMGIGNSTLSHHLDKLKSEALVQHAARSVSRAEAGGRFAVSDVVVRGEVPASMAPTSKSRAATSERSVEGAG